jgi:hypothetical protein
VLNAVDVSTIASRGNTRFPADTLARLIDFIEPTKCERGDHFIRFFTNPISIR